MNRSTSVGFLRRVSEAYFLFNQSLVFFVLLEELNNINFFLQMWLEHEKQMFCGNLNMAKCQFSDK